MTALESRAPADGEGSERQHAAASPADIVIDPELADDFVVEAREHLRSIESNLLSLEQGDEKEDSIHCMFRGFHTIKGLAGFLGLAELGAVCHEVETLLDSARNGTLTVSPAVVDVLLDGEDYVSRAVDRFESAWRAHRAPDAADNPDELIRAIQFIRHTAEEPAESDPKSPALSVEQPQPGSAALNHGDGGTRAGSSGNQLHATAIKVDTSKLDALIDTVGEMIIAQTLVQHNPDLTRIESPALSRGLTELARITGEIQKSAMSLRMIQIDTLFQRMTRLVRDLCRKAGKEARLVTSGSDIELDRNIVEQLADPLMHMVRNSIDHGIETPDERLAAGKSPVATISLHASHQAGSIFVDITDDGRGLNRDKILAKAVSRGLVSDSAQLTDSEVFELIFSPGFSTADQVTEISGRGVGMDVVRQHIQSLRGTIDIRTVPGLRTTFRLKVPLTLAIIDGLIAGVGAERYIVPIFTVKEVLRPTAGMVSTIEGSNEILSIRGQVLPVVRLYSKFGIPPRSRDPGDCVLIVTETDGREFCLMVDELLGKQEVVIKSLGRAFETVKYVAGGAILGDGKVGLILEMRALYSPN